MPASKRAVKSQRVGALDIPTKTESSGGLLDDVSAGFQNLFDGSAPTNNKTSKSQGFKDSH